jgi:hypothetical protein
LQQSTQYNNNSKTPIELQHLNMLINQDQSQNRKKIHQNNPVHQHPNKKTAQKTTDRFRPCNNFFSQNKNKYKNQNIS